jgi:hypothetical protein
MNKPIIATIAALIVFSSTTGVAFGQGFYGGGQQQGGSIGTATPEQLQQCEQLGIPAGNCSDVTILAKQRLTAAQENPATGSGTPMLSTESGQMTVFIGVLAAIFGGVAAAFFFKGRGAKPVKT